MTSLMGGIFMRIFIAQNHVYDIKISLANLAQYRFSTGLFHATFQPGPLHVATCTATCSGTGPTYYPKCSIKLMGATVLT